MVRKLAAGAILLCVALGGGWLILRHVAENRLQSGIAQLRASLAPEGRFSYASAQALPLHLGAMFTGVTLQRDGVVMTASHVTLDHATPRHIGSVRLLDVRIHGNGAHATVASIDADDLSDPSGRQPTRWKDLRIGHLRLHGLLVQADRAGGIRVHADESELSQTPPTSAKDGVSDLWMTQASIQQGDGETVLALDRLTQHAGLQPDGIASATDLFGLSTPPDSPLGRQLAGIGYAGAKGDGRIQLRYTDTGTPSAGRLALGPLRLRLHGIGEVALTVGLDGLPPFTSPAPSPAEMSQRVSQALLTGLSLTYDDAGLADHALDLLAQRSAMTTAALRTAITRTLEQRALSDGGHGFEQQAIRFLNDPRHLEIILSPPAPLSLPDLGHLRAEGDQAKAIAALGLSVTAD